MLRVITCGQFFLLDIARDFHLFKWTCRDLQVKLDFYERCPDFFGMKFPFDGKNCPQLTVKNFPFTVSTR